MPVPGNGTPAGSVPLDALEAEQTADLLAAAATVIGALAGRPGTEAARAALAARTWRSMREGWNTVLLTSNGPPELDHEAAEPAGL